jgi:hypothetical protein
LHEPAVFAEELVYSNQDHNNDLIGRICVSRDNVISGTWILESLYMSANLTISLDPTKLKPIHCRRRLKGIWQGILDPDHTLFDLLALSDGRVVIDCGGGGGDIDSYGEFGEVAGGNSGYIRHATVEIGGHSFARTLVAALNGKKIVVRCASCSTSKPFFGIEYVIYTSWFMVSADPLSRFLMDKFNFSQ